MGGCLDSVGEYRDLVGGSNPPQAILAKAKNGYWLTWQGTSVRKMVPDRGGSVRFRNIHSAGMLPVELILLQELRKESTRVQGPGAV